MSHPTPPPLQRHEVDGLSVLRRRPDRPLATVVLVHGAMDRAASFGRVMRRLPALDVVAYDRRGYAGPPASTPLGLAGHAADLRAVVRWTGAEEVTVVGHSLGGTIAVAAAGGPAARDAVIGTVVAFESPFPALDGSHDQVGGGALEVGRRAGPAAAGEHFYRLMVGDSTWERLREGDRSARRSEGATLLAELEDLRRPSTCPDPRGDPGLAVVAAAGSASAERLRQHAELLDRSLGGAGVRTIQGAGHGAHLTHPGEFARLVLDVVDRPAERATA